jgi:hypothetical protein
MRQFVWVLGLMALLAGAPKSLRADSGNMTPAPATGQSAASVGSNASDAATMSGDEASPDVDCFVCNAGLSVCIDTATDRCALLDCSYLFCVCEAHCHQQPDNCGNPPGAPSSC